MKKLLFCTALLLLVCSLNLRADTSPNGHAYTVAKEGLYYSKDVKNNCYQLVDADYTENLVIPDAIDDIPVTAVYNMKNRSDFESVSLGANLTTADFSGCSYIANIDFSRVSTSLDCNFKGTQIKELILPKDIKGNFSDCTQLEKAVFSDKAMQCSFDNCSKLQSVKMHPEMTVCPSFTNCTSLTSIDIPAKINIVGGFRGCTSLTTVNIADDSQATIIAGGAFSGTAITEFTCPSTVKIIGSQAFAATKLTKFVFPAAYGNYGGMSYWPYESADANDIFNGCQYLTQLDYPSLETFWAMLPGFYHYGGLGSLLAAENRGVGISICGEPLSEITVPQTIKEANLTFISGVKKIATANRTTPLYFYLYYMPDLENVEIGAGEVEINIQNNPLLKTIAVSEKNKTKKIAIENNPLLENLYFPEVTKVSNCYNNASLKSISFPKAVEIGDFKDNISLSMVDLPMIETNQ